MIDVTISTQNGPNVSLDHNRRNPSTVSKESHIKPGEFFEIWLDRNPREVYKELFGEAVKKYNKNQKQKSKRIRSYFSKILKSKQQHPMYEMIVGVYSRNGKPLTKEQQVDILKTFIYGNDNFQGWIERNPSMAVFGIYVHGDEEAFDDRIHIHIDYIPVGKGFKKGLETRVSLSRALEEMGFQHISRKVTKQVQWEKRENSLLESICEEYGLVVLHPDVAGRKHEETKRYKLRKEIEKLQSEKDALASVTTDIIAPYIRQYMRAIELVSKMTNQVKRMQAFDELESVFGPYSFAVERAMEKIENKDIPTDKEKLFINEGVEAGEKMTEKFEIMLNEKEDTQWAEKKD